MFVKTITSSKRNIFDFESRILQKRIKFSPVYLYLFLCYLLYSVHVVWGLRPFEGYQHTREENFPHVTTAKWTSWSCQSPQKYLSFFLFTLHTTSPWQYKSPNHVCLFFGNGALVFMASAQLLYQSLLYHPSNDRILV